MNRQFIFVRKQVETPHQLKTAIFSNGNFLRCLPGSGTGLDQRCTGLLAAGIAFPGNGNLEMILALIQNGLAGGNVPRQIFYALLSAAICDG